MEEHCEVSRSKIQTQMVCDPMMVERRFSYEFFRKFLFFNLISDFFYFFLFIIFFKFNIESFD